MKRYDWGKLYEWENGTMKVVDFNPSYCEVNYPFNHYWFVENNVEKERGKYDVNGKRDKYNTEYWKRTEKPIYCEEHCIVSFETNHYAPEKKTPIPFCCTPQLAKEAFALFGEKKLLLEHIGMLEHRDSGLFDELKGLHESGSKDKNNIEWMYDGQLCASIHKRNEEHYGAYSHNFVVVRKLSPYNQMQLAEYWYSQDEYHKEKGNINNYDTCDGRFSPTARHIATDNKSFCEFHGKETVETTKGEKWCCTPDFEAEALEYCRSYSPKN